MHALHNLHSSLLDLVENTRWGSRLFRLVRFCLFSMLIFVGSKMVSGQFLGFEFSDILFMAITVLVFLLGPGSGGSASYW